MHDPCEIGPHLDWNGIGWKCIFLFMQRHVDLLAVSTIPTSSNFALLGVRGELCSIADLSLLTLILSRFSLIMTESFQRSDGRCFVLSDIPSLFLAIYVENFIPCELPRSPCRIDAYFDDWYKPLPSMAWRC